MEKPRQEISSDLTIRAVDLAKLGSFEDVLPCVFKNLDIKRLKMCRLVSKRWNEEACRVLRKHCIFSTNNRSRNYQREFTELLNFRNWNFPLPFKKFSFHLSEEVLGDCCKKVNEIIVENNNYEIVKLRVGPMFSSVTSATLHPILQRHGSTLTHLKIDQDISQEQDQDQQFSKTKEKLSLPVLSALTFNVTTSWEDGLQDLLTSIIAGAPALKHVTVDYWLCEHYSLLSLMHFAYFQNIQSFKADVFTYVIAAEDVIACLKHFKSLKSLSISSRAFGCIWIDDDVTRNLMQSLWKFAGSIEQLDLSCLRLDPDDLEEEIPVCPKLQSLKLFEVDLGLQYLERFPALKNLGFYRSYFEANLTLESDVSYGTVDTIEFLNKYDFLSRHEWTLLQKIFPNCTHLNVSTSSALGYCKAMRCNEQMSTKAYYTWSLQSLTVENQVNFAGGCSDEMFILLTGISRDGWEFVMDSGFDVELIRKNANILAMTDLTSLTLRDYELTNSIITLGLSHMKNLKHLQTDLSETLNVDIIKESLEHLEALVVTNCCTCPFSHAKQVQIELLFARIPSAHCGCKSRNQEL